MAFRTVLFASALLASFAATAPIDTVENLRRDGGPSNFWLANIPRQGTAVFGSPSYKVFRNVKTDCGAKGDGVTDDTAAINSCISQGNRCGQGCDSNTVTPAVVYFPPGTYVVSAPIIQYYYTQLIGDALSLPTLKASPGFAGIAVIDADPYDNTGNNWYGNTNNFFRSIRNFNIDLTGLPPSTGTGIHWQCAQAATLQNIVFNMVQGASSKQQGIFMDNGSGGFMSDLVFNGGNYGAFFGNQQETSRNLTFNGCNTAIFMNWNWMWTFHGLNINNCQVGIDMANSPTNQTVGSVYVLDSKFVNTPVGVKSAFTANSIPTTGGTLVFDHVDFTGCSTAVQSSTGAQVLAGGSVVQSWAQGRAYTGSTGTRVQGTVPAPSKPAALLNGNNIFARSRPQYESYPVSAFVSVKSKGARGDGMTDDTQAIQNALNGLQDGQILYFDHGAYLISDTVTIPKNAIITGEIWPLIMAHGPQFQDQNNPKPVFQVGNAGDVGAVEMSDIIFETLGPVPGAILLQWNSGASSQGSNGMWDVHFRVGGTAGTKLQSDSCAKNPSATHGANPACVGAHTLFYATNSSSVYMEGTWGWTADHELDRPDHGQIDIYNGRGARIESQGPMWLYGTSFEHSVLYNYQFKNARNIFAGHIQTETPYFQPNPASPAPFTAQATIGDPSNFNGQGTKDNMAWALRIVDSSDILIYGAGLYSFFDNYGQDCVAANNCQNSIVDIEGAVSNINLFGLSTKASVNMVSTVGNGYTAGGSTVTSVSVLDADNRNNFCATVALWRPV